MPNIPYIDEADCPAELAARIRARRNGRLLHLDRLLLHSPPYAEGWNRFMGAVRSDLALPANLRELAICAVARLNGADYEWQQHAPEFLAAGGRPDQLAALDDASAACADARFDAIEQAVLALSDEMTRTVKVTRATMQALRTLLPDRQVVELVGTIAAYNMVSRFLVALDIDLEAD